MKSYIVAGVVAIIAVLFLLAPVLSGIPLANPAQNVTTAETDGIIDVTSVGIASARDWRIEISITEIGFVQTGDSGDYQKVINNSKIVCSGSGRAPQTIDGISRTVAQKDAKCTKITTDPEAN